MKCSIMSASEFNVPTVLWSWVQNVSGSLEQCNERLQAYQLAAKHGQKYILTEELNTTTPMLSGSKLISQLTLIPKS